MTASSIRLIGNASALMSKQRRGTILSKINSSGTLSSLASEDFPGAANFLFGEGFEARIKTWSETSKTLLQAAQVGQRSSQFFSRLHHSVQKTWEPLEWCSTPSPIIQQQQLPVSRIIQEPSQKLPGFQTSSSNF